MFTATNSTPCSPQSIILLIALPPAPPTPKTNILGFNSFISGVLKLIVIVPPCYFSHLRFARFIFDFFIAIALNFSNKPGFQI